MSLNTRAEQLTGTEKTARTEAAPFDLAANLEAEAWKLLQHAGECPALLVEFNNLFTKAQAARDQQERVHLRQQEDKRLANTSLELQLALQGKKKPEKKKDPTPEELEASASAKKLKTEKEERKAAAEALTEKNKNDAAAKEAADKTAAEEKATAQAERKRGQREARNKNQQEKRKNLLNSDPDVEKARKTKTYYDELARACQQQGLKGQKKGDRARATLSRYSEEKLTTAGLKKLPDGSFAKL